VPKFYFEDFSPGWTAEYGPRRVTREEIIGFAAQFDPQPMHLDEEAARGTMLGGLGASGWHTCCVMMKMVADGVLLDSASMGAPGIEEVKWLKPVRPGDSLTVRGSVLSARASQSRAGSWLRQFPLGGVQRSRREGDDADLPADAAAPQREASA
jgi:acyl dehydratase